MTRGRLGLGVLVAVAMAIVAALGAGSSAAPAQPAPDPPPLAVPGLPPIDLGPQDLAAQFDDFAEACRNRTSRKHARPSRARVERGRRLFNSATAFDQRPSQDVQRFNEKLSCKSCHLGAGTEDGENHVVGTQGRRLALRQTPHLFDVLRIPDRRDPRADAGGFGWDGRFGCAQAFSKSAIMAPTEMNAEREPSQRQLDDVVAFIGTLKAPRARPGVDFDPRRARRGERLFNQERPVVDPGGEFATGDQVSCATCHVGAEGSDHQFHRILLPRGDPIVDPGRVDPDGDASDKGLTPPGLRAGGDPTAELPGVDGGQITSFKTPSLRGVRLTAPYFHEGLAGDPTGTAHDGSRLPQEVAARVALAEVVAFYSERFAFNYTPGEQAALVEFLMSR